MKKKLEQSEKVEIELSENEMKKLVEHVEAQFEYEEIETVYKFSNGQVAALSLHPKHVYSRTELTIMQNDFDEMIFDNKYQLAIEFFGQIIQLQFEYVKNFGIGESKKFFATLRDVTKCDVLKGPEIRNRFKMTIENFMRQAFLIVNQDADSTTGLFANSKHSDLSDLSNALFSFIDYYSAEFESRLTEDKMLEKVESEVEKLEPKSNAALNDVNAEFEHIEKIESSSMNVEVEKTEKKQPQQKSRAMFELNLPLADIVDAAVEEYINSSDIIKNIQSYIKAEAQKLQPNVIMIGNNKAGMIEGKTHKLFKKVLSLANIERCVFLSGPAGTGKTTLASQVAKALSLNFGHISCTAGMSEAHLLGRMTAHGEYLTSTFVEIYENGGVFLFDEIDASDPNTLLIINSALANGYLSIPNRVANPRAKRHADFICITAANTWGTGSVEYSGRAPLDAAFFDRFVGSKVMVGYDVELEKTIAGEELNRYAEKLWRIRKNCEDKKIRKVVSTRAFVSLSRQCSSNNESKIDFSEFLDSFLLGWSNEEKSKALEGVI